MGLKKSDEKKVEGVASTKRIERANELLASLFNIDNTFYMTGAKDKGNSLILEFSNFDFDVRINIKDVVEQGLVDPEE